MRLLKSVSLPLVAALLSAGNVVAQDGDAIRVYDFNDVRVNCGYWGTTTSGLYEDLAFPQPTNVAPCNVDNTDHFVALVPSEFSGGRVEIRVGLPAPASAVSIESFLYLTGDMPTLIAYDENGVELGRDGDATMNEWVTLSVEATGENPIVEIGLFMPQLVNRLDNLTVNYGWGTEPEPLPEPDVEPQDEGEGSDLPAATDPSSLADCQNGGWVAFGFSNQGQCVSFVRNGRDSRGATLRGGRR